MLLVSGSFAWKYEGKISEKVVWQRAGLSSGVQLYGNMMEEFWKRGLKKGWSVIRGSFVQKYDGEGFWKSGLKEGWSLIRGSVAWKYKGKVSQNVVLKVGFSLIRGSIASHSIFEHMVVVTFGSLTRIVGESSMIHSPPGLFFSLQWRPTHTHKFHFLGQDQSTVAQRAEMTLAKHSLTSCMSACFPHCAWTAQSAHSDFVGSRVFACWV